MDYLLAFEDVPAAERALAERTRVLLEERVMPRVADLYEAGGFPDDVVPGLAGLGLFGAHVPGMATADALAWGLALRELERCDSGLRSFVSVQACLAMTAIARYGSEEQRRTWLPRMAKGEAIGCFALTEPGHGSDPGAMETRATPVDGGHRLSGHKRWATNSPIAAVAVIWAQIGAAGDPRGVRGFVVPLPHPGVEVRRIDRKLSLRVSHSGEIRLDDVELPADAILPGANSLGAALACLNEARYSIVWGAVGAAEACLEAALARTRARHQFGRPLAGFQLVQQKLVEMLDDVTTAQLVARQLAGLKDAGRLRHQQVSFGKRHNVAAAQRVAARARALFGAEGIVVDSQVMRHMANLETVATYEGTEDVHTLVLGADLTGEPAFR
ncbi:MAG TPA: acyl-CoA dehydrogenase family protein [Chloroflexota bacterium]|jgi:glutaryl-CoA dehydrogenase|nr:acyl-CoA dehydrogenase family protein [Chloroflexota bacterium]